MKRQRDTTTTDTLRHVTPAEHTTRFYTQIPLDVWCVHILRKLDVTSLFRFAAASRYFIDISTVNNNDGTGPLLQCKPSREIDGCVISLHNIMTRYRERFDAGRHDQHVCLNNDLVLRFTNLLVLHLDDDICCVTDGALSRLLRLRVLHLDYDTRITDEGVQTLAKLRVLVIGEHNTSITDQSISRLTKLAHLDLEWNGTITDAGLCCLFARLQVLNLAHNSAISDVGLGCLTNLTELHLSGSLRITDAGVAPLTSLTKLRLSNTGRVTDRALSLLTGLQQLTISVSLITDRSLSLLTRLRSLRLYNKIEGLNGSALSRLSQLAFLCIAHIDNIGDEALLEMARAITSLRSLELGPNTSITNQALTCFTSLHTLSLRGNTSITDQAFLASPHFATSLTHLSLVRNERITLDGLTCLKGLKQLRYHNAKQLGGVHPTTLQQLMPGLTGNWSEYQVHRSEEERAAYRNDIVLADFI